MSCIFNEFDALINLEAPLKLNREAIRAVIWWDKRHKTILSRQRYAISDFHNLIVSSGLRFTLVIPVSSP